MNIKFPSVSIVLPTYNRRKYLPYAITSVLNQSYRNFELIIIDDGSSDGTEEVVAEIQDPRIIYLKCSANRGQSFARNVGVRLARAPLLAFQDSDDEWLPEKLADQVAVLDRCPQVAVAYGDLLRVPRVGEPFTVVAPEVAIGQIFDNRPSIYATYGIGIQTCLVRRDVLIELGGFEERLRNFEDMDLLMRISRRYRMLRLPCALVRYNETEGVLKDQQLCGLARNFLYKRYALSMFRRKPKQCFRELARLMIRGQASRPS